MNAIERKQIEELYLEMYDMLMSYGLASLQNEALAEEAVQETFHVACREADKLCSSPNPRGWLVLTMHNTVGHIIRERATAKRIVETYLMVQIKELSFCEDRIHLNILYENVVDMEEFRLLSEMAIQGKSHKEMAQARGITVQACKKRVQRAKEILQEKIKKDVTF